MPMYRFSLPVRAVGTYRLPDAGFTTDGIALTPAREPEYMAQIDIESDSVGQAYALSQQHVERLFGYLSLLDDRAAFLLDGREGMRACNLDLRENPIPHDQ